MNSRLLYLLPLLTLVIMAGFFGWSLLSGRDPASIGSVMVNRPAPPLAAPALRPGEPALTSDLLKTGKPVLVNFFASWCAPCEVEQPVLMSLKARRIPIVGVAYKDAPSNTQAFLDRLGDPFTQRLVDRDGAAGVEFGVTGVPETYLVGADGVVLDKHTGPLSEADAQRLAARVLTGR